VRAGRPAVALGVALALALLGAAGRGPAAATEATDMLGRRVRVPGVPERIVSLAPSITETVFALGAGEQLVGVTDYCDYPPEARRKPRVGGIYTPSFEAILALRPAVVLATAESNLPEHIRRLEALGIPVYVIRPVTFATVLESIRRVGDVLGRPAVAARVVAAMEREADAIARAVAGAPRPRVLYVLWPNPLIAPGRDTLITELIRRAGGDSVTAAEPVLYPRLSLETVVERRPERILVARHGTPPGDERVPEIEQLAALAAVPGGRVEVVDGDLLHRPGPRMVEALRLLAHLLHPEQVR
jgi:iron complex transport system substrate-binding protein